MNNVYLLGTSLILKRKQLKFVPLKGLRQAHMHPRCNFLKPPPGTNLFGVESFGGHNYYFSWLDEDAKVVKFDDGLFDEAEKLVQRFATPSGTGSTQGTTAGVIGFLGKLSVCFLLFRKRCMDLVSFETRQEYDWVKGFIDGGVNIFRSYV